MTASILSQKKTNLLLVGKAGTGKTHIIQQICSIFNKKLLVYNVNAQSEMSDIIGGYQPLDVFVVIKKFIIEALNFCLTFIQDEVSKL
mmetsp:Transcript_47735/g.104044  ORF Transcript_47735/g.104044 Transcript_47735/m.104044 type:complete len:88 (+) Transcript_47735:375-638(+)